LCIFKVKGNEFIFGAFTTATWDCTGKYKSDSNAFLFSLINKDNKPCKIKIDANEHQYAIYCGPQYGPVFGGGNDIDIVSNANTKDCSSRLGHTYKHPQYAFGSNKARTFLAGFLGFQLIEIEVYQKE